MRDILRLQAASSYRAFISDMRTGNQMVLSGVYSVNMSKTEPVQSVFPRSSMTTYNSSNNSIIALLKHGTVYLLRICP